MASEEHQNGTLVAKVAWPLLVLTAVLQMYSGLSSVAYVFMGVSSPASGIGGWTVASMGGLQSVAAFVLAARRDLRGTTLAVAGSMLLGWFSILPSVVEQGLDLHGDDKITPVFFILSPLAAIAAAVLAWRNVYPIAAALIASAMTFVGILIVIAFAIIITVYGF